MIRWPYILCLCPIICFARFMGLAFNNFLKNENQSKKGMCLFLRLEIASNTIKMLGKRQFE